MTTEEREQSLLRIERTLRLRWWIFTAMMMAMGFLAWEMVMALQTIARIESVVRSADARSLRNEAAIDSAIKQQIIYQQQVAQSIDFLAKKNPQINVPRAIVRPPKPTTTPEDHDLVLSDSDLTRPSVKPSPTPTSAPQSTQTSSTRKGKGKRKPSPTPGPWERFFKPRSTR